MRRTTWPSASSSRTSARRSRRRPPRDSDTRAPGERRRIFLAGAAFLAAILGWVYGISNPGVGGDSELGGALLLVGLAALYLGTGLIAGHWIVLLLCPLAVVLAWPAGYPHSSSGEPFPIWSVLLIFEVIGLPLMAVGVLVAKARARHRLER